MSISWRSLSVSYNSHVFLMLHKLLLGVAGIYGAYITMSLISQKMYNREYTPTDPSLPPGKFTYPPLIIWLGCLLCAIAGTVIGAIKGQSSNPIPLKEQMVLSVLYSANILTTNFALLYISYPIQVIGRNIRFLFVVIVGAFFSRVKNSHTHLKLGKHKIFMAILITIGVLLFNFAKDSKKDKGDKHDPQYEWIGYVFLLISVICDAFFTDSQAYSKANYKPTSNQLFTITNFYAFIFSLGLAVFSGTFIQSLIFVKNYPGVLLDMFLMGGLQVLGQISIYYVITNFKQHVFPLISTTRKIITVLLSIFVYGHTLKNMQWVAIAIVFCGMFYELWEELRHEKKIDDRKAKHLPTDSDMDASSPQKPKRH